jgi:hypothetical protein
LECQDAIYRAWLSTCGKLLRCPKVKYVVMVPQAPDLAP